MSELNRMQIIAALSKANPSTPYCITGIEHQDVVNAMTMLVEDGETISWLRDVVDELQDDLRARTDGRWQDIETAPKDGTQFLAFNPMVGIYHTAFTSRFHDDDEPGDYEGFPCGFWHNGSPWCYPFGRWDCVPTKWTPLPPPPAEDAP